MHSFFELDPNKVLQAAEVAGFSPTGEYWQLNSYENRVFDLVLEGPARPRIIAKFYRPGRWEKRTILEEHQFLQELAQEGLTVVTAHSGSRMSGTLVDFQGLHVAFFKKKLGRIPQEFLHDELSQVGRKLALLHNVGSRSEFSHRPTLMQTPAHFSELLYFLKSWVAPEVWPRYHEAALSLIEHTDEQIDFSEFIRIHGDAHKGNLLHDGKEFFFVDFDDCCMGPAAQDFWMLFSSLESEDEQEQILKGYEELREFPLHQWDWVPLLRGFRLVHYSAWIARRWEDPSFPRLFPHFNTYNYWAEETEALEKTLQAVLRRQ